MSFVEPIRGVLMANGVLRLDRPPNVPIGPVEVLVRSTATTDNGDWWKALQEILADQTSRGFTGGVTEVDRDDEGYDKRMREIDANTIPRSGGS